MRSSAPRRVRHVAESSQRAPLSRGRGPSVVRAGQLGQGVVAVEYAAAATPPAPMRGVVAQRRSAPAARQIVCAARRRLVPPPPGSKRHHHRRAPVDQQRIAKLRRRADEHHAVRHRFTSAARPGRGPARLSGQRRMRLARRAGVHAPFASRSVSIHPALRSPAGAVCSSTRSPCPERGQRGAPSASHLPVMRTW